MKRIAAVLLTIVLSGCTPLGTMCAAAILANPETAESTVALCSDPLLRDNHPINGTLCVCNGCGGFADDRGGVSGPHNRRNSTSDGPCPFIGTACTPAGFGGNGHDGGVIVAPRDLSLPFRLPDLASPAPVLDMAVAPDLAAAKPDMTALPDMISVPDLYRSCLARFQAIEGCRILPEKVRQQCIDKEVGGNTEAAKLAACVDQKCPPGTLLRDACTNSTCDRECCTALQQCD